MAAFAPHGENHTFIVANSAFEVPKRYQLIRSVGTGAYGVVISALDEVTKEKVAIKKIPRAFDDLVDAKRILREIRLLRQFDHENIVNVVNVLPPTDEDWSDLYIVSELMETDLHRIIYSKQDLSADHVQYFVYQILRALKYMHSANVLHRDLKPSNLLINSNCDLKVCDLGLARGVEPDLAPGLGAPGELTEYVVTRWYRAPEIMLACQEYTKAIDVWSCGCILGELLLREALFPGDDYIDQIRKIVRRLGKPPADELDFVTSEKARRFILDLADDGDVLLDAAMDDAAFPAQRTDRLAASMLPRFVDPEPLDLLGAMLSFDPRSRCSVQDALEHPFMASLHLEADEPRAEFTCSFEFERQDLGRDGLKQLVWEEMTHYNPTLRRAPEPAAQTQTPQADANGHRNGQWQNGAAACAIPPPESTLGHEMMMMSPTMPAARTDVSWNQGYAAQPDPAQGEPWPAQQMQFPQQPSDAQAPHAQQ
ncbi:kinase-like domain-containing protein [Pelagophyceae sp. CCMP2097]|nr:kinase-like domain-containing protein [Pelagophyceae sp. CCMP2097]